MDGSSSQEKYIGDDGAAALRFGSAIGRSAPGPGGRSLLASLAFHAALIAAFFLAGMRPSESLPRFESYRVRLVSPPPQVQGEIEPVTAPVAAPVPVQPPPEPEPEAVQPRPQPAPPTPAPAQIVPPPAEPAPAEPVPGNDPEPGAAGGENLDVRIEGREFPYPDYLQNIIIQLNRFFRWTGAPNLEAQVTFYIRRDGSAAGARVLQSSGNALFDIAAMSAVEQAGRRGVFGPLPDGWQSERLDVNSSFQPP